MNYLIISMIVVTIVSLGGVIFILSKIVSRQDKVIKDLMDRVTAPSFKLYQEARERELVITEQAKKGLDMIAEEYGDQDTFPIN